MVAAIGNSCLCQGRDFGSAMPKRMSTGDRTIPGRITRRGDVICTRAGIIGALAFCSGQQTGAKTLARGYLAAANRLHHNVLATALALVGAITTDRLAQSQLKAS
jgi:hypothetical protein